MLDVCNGGQRKEKERERGDWFWKWKKIDERHFKHYSGLIISLSTSLNCLIAPSCSLQKVVQLSSSLLHCHCLPNLWATCSKTCAIAFSLTAGQVEKGFSQQLLNGTKTPFQWCRDVKHLSYLFSLSLFLSLWDFRKTAWFDSIRTVKSCSILSSKTLFQFFVHFLWY